MLPDVVHLDADALLVLVSDPLVILVGEGNLADRIVVLRPLLALDERTDLVVGKDAGLIGVGTRVPASQPLLDPRSQAVVLLASQRV